MSCSRALEGACWEGWLKWKIVRLYGNVGIKKWQRLLMLQPPSKRFLQIAFLGWNTKYLFPNVMKQNKSHSIDTSNMSYQRPWIQTKQSCRYPSTITFLSLAPVLRLQDENLFLVNKKNYLCLLPAGNEKSNQPLTSFQSSKVTQKSFSLTPDLFNKWRRWSWERVKHSCKVTLLEMHTDRTGISISQHSAFQ